jgi:hypothetical protein
MYDYLASFAHENINFLLLLAAPIGLSVFSVTMLKMALNRLVFKRQRSKGGCGCGPASA